MDVICAHAFRLILNSLVQFSDAHRDVKLLDKTKMAVGATANATQQKAQVIFVIQQLGKLLLFA